MDKKLTSYDDCMETMRELIATWERLRPEEELVFLVLPKKDEKARERQLGHICQMLLKEKY